VYSSSRLVTLCLSGIRLPSSDEFKGGEIGQRLVWSHAVVGVFPAQQLAVERRHLIGFCVHGNTRDAAGTGFQDVGQGMTGRNAGTCHEHDE